MKYHARHRFGFTLVEPLVGIGIIAPLISTLLPTLNSARESASAVKCLANERSIAQTLVQYTNDNRCSLPTSCFFNNAQSADDLGLPAAFSDPNAWVFTTPNNKKGVNGLPTHLNEDLMMPNKTYPSLIENPNGS